MKPFVLDIDIYRCSVVFLCETTKDEWQKYYKAHKAQLTEADNQAVLGEYDSDALGFCIETDGNDYICAIRDRNRVGVAAHELFHTADMILTGRGYKFDGIDEPVAYLIEYLADNFYKQSSL